MLENLSDHTLRRLARVGLKALETRQAKRYRKEILETDSRHSKYRKHWFNTRYPKIVQFMRKYGIDWRSFQAFSGVVARTKYLSQRPTNQIPNMKTIKEMDDFYRLAQAIFVYKTAPYCPPDTLHGFHLRKNLNIGRPPQKLLRSADKDIFASWGLLYRSEYGDFLKLIDDSSSSLDDDLRIELEHLRSLLSDERLTLEEADTIRREMASLTAELSSTDMLRSQMALLKYSPYIYWATYKSSQSFRNVSVSEEGEESDGSWITALDDTKGLSLVDSRVESVLEMTEAIISCDYLGQSLPPELEHYKDRILEHGGLGDFWADINKLKKSLWHKNRTLLEKTWEVKHILNKINDPVDKWASKEHKRLPRRLKIRWF